MFSGILKLFHVYNRKILSWNQRLCNKLWTITKQKQKQKNIRLFKHPLVTHDMVRSIFMYPRMCLDGNFMTAKCSAKCLKKTTTKNIIHRPQKQNNELKGAKPVCRAVEVGWSLTQRDIKLFLLLKVVEACYLNINSWCHLPDFKFTND